ncbi:hypothetical protein Cgig2_030664 [Carnegiea gigantea]|uniref:Ubiquitin-like protease family profile domain-containing protein n=1 Tax=Carnegiea gigantea TaxID=171969 RepID=A0A9Q1GP62_9CARY|nr:hypothetical protein Cgig2_030664 [Carnegiea gigantea]
MDGNFDLPHASRENVNAEYLKGLINVVPCRGAGDKAGRYCVGQFVYRCIAICWRNDKNCIPHCVALPFSWSRRIRFGVYLLGCIIHATFISDEIWGSIKKRVLGSISYCSTDDFLSVSYVKLFLPLFEAVDEHWMLFVADLKGRRFLVYDSLATKKAPSRTDLIQNAVSDGLYILSVTCIYLRNLICPNVANRRRLPLVFCAPAVVVPSHVFPAVTLVSLTVVRCCSGHECGVYVMVFMDLLSLGVK